MTTLLDTRAVPASDRPDYWTAGIAEHFFPMGVESLGPRPFEARLTGGAVGAVTVRSIVAPPRIGRRTATKCSSGTESVVRLGTPFLAALARTVEREPVSEREAEGLSDMLVGMLWALHGSSDGDLRPATRPDALLERMRRYAIEH